MNDNTILRIKVPAHLYESVKEQLSLTEAKKAGHNLGAGMELVKEKKMKAPKEGMKTMEEDKEYMETKHDSSEDMAAGMIKKETKHTEMEMKTRSLEELKAAKAKLDKKIKQMETLAEAPREGVYDDFAKWKASFPEETEFKQENNYMLAKDTKGKELGKWNPITKSGAHADDFQYDSLEENVNEDVTRGAEISANNMMNAISSGDPFATGVALVLGVAGAVIAGANAGAIKNTLVGWWKGLKDPAVKEKIKDFAEENNVKLG